MGKSSGPKVKTNYGRPLSWNAEREKTLKLIEVRGKLPDEIECPDTHEVFRTDDKGGTIPKQARFQCRESTCGLSQEIVVSVKKSGKSGPVAACTVQGFCPECKRLGYPYDGRFFDYPKPAGYNAAHREWERLRDTDLANFWPTDTIPLGYMTPIQNDLPAHGYPDWWMLFNVRQLIVHSRLLRKIVTDTETELFSKEVVIGAFQQYLRNQNMFCFWNPQRDTLEPMFSNNNYHPKIMMIENCVFSDLGRGNWKSSSSGIVEGVEWSMSPWEVVAVDDLDARQVPEIESVKSRSLKVSPGDLVGQNTQIACGSSSGLASIGTATYDLVLTDPPVGG
jgi:hypothetical protein